jgi:hypothetical protein
MEILCCVNGHNHKMEGLGRLKKSDNLSWNRTRDFPACSTVSQSSSEYKCPLHDEHKKYEHSTFMHTILYLVRYDIFGYVT